MATQRGREFIDVTRMMKPSFEPSELRKTVVDMAYAGNAVHLGCA